MKSRLVTLLLAFTALATARAGTISGVVQAKAPAIPEAGGGGTEGYGSWSLKMAEKVDYSRLTDFVVYINEVLPATAATVTVVTARTTQQDANFEPHVLPVAVGTTVQWPNRDSIFHNVYSTSDAKQFDLQFYKQERVPEVKFDKVGRVDVFCAIHTRMHCIILVLPNSYFAKADARGRFSISGIPPGKYKVRAWHERLPFQEKEIVVPAEGEVRDVNFTLSVGAYPAN